MKHNKSTAGSSPKPIGGQKHAGGEWEARSRKRKQTRQEKTWWWVGEREEWRATEGQWGKIPGLCVQDESESVWQCVNLWNVYVNPECTHIRTHENKKLDLDWAHRWCERSPRTTSMCSFNHRVQYRQYKAEIRGMWLIQWKMSQSMQN